MILIGGLTDRRKGVINLDETAKRHGEEVREKILEAVVSYIKEHGYSPSVREIGDMVGLKSTSSVQAHLAKMLKSGMLETDCGIGASRALRVPGYRFVKIRGDGD